MLKNVRLKRILKQTIFIPISLVNYIIPKNKNSILIYAANRGIGDNLLPMKNYLMNSGFQSKFVIICCVENRNFINNQDVGVRYVTKMHGFLYFLKSKYVISSTGQIPIKPSRKQQVWYVDHGIAFKSYRYMGSRTNGYNHYFTKFVVPGDVYVPIIEKEFNCKKEDIAVAGEPMTDIFYLESEHYDLGDYNKTILWAPTFRQSDYLGYNDSDEGLLPGVYEEQYEQLNLFLRDKKYLLIVKLHPSQDIGEVKKLMFSNLKIYTDHKFKEDGLDVYKLLKQVDCLLADYSSVFLQFLHLNKPIGFVIPDFKEYGEKRGFVFHNPLDYMPGVKIKNIDQLLAFIEELGSKDDYTEERIRVRDIVYKYQDGLSCKRIVDMMGIYK